MIKWIQNKIKDKETLSSIEGDILSTKLQIKMMKDNKLKRDIREVSLIKISDVYNVQEMENNMQENELESILEQSETKRQHLLDRRGGWLNRFIWSVVSPIIVTVITTYLLYRFGLLK